jgi:hypothetical protein
MELDPLNAADLNFPQLMYLLFAFVAGTEAVSLNGHQPPLLLLRE